MSVWALVMAAGSGTRMGAQGNKVLQPLRGMTVLERSVRAFDGEVDRVMVVTRAVDAEAVRQILPDVPLTVGGATRQQSVLCGLRALPEDVEYVLVHDAARPFVDRETIRRCVASVRQYGSGVVSMPVKDTVKRVGADMVIVDTPPREALYTAQTPQGFRVDALRAAIERLEARGETATDDASAMEAAGVAVRTVEGSYANIKLTTPEDMKMAEYLLGGNTETRTGYGYDVHRLVEDRRLILCGVEVPYEKGLLGHSDADVATHALMDALLGAAAMGDIGRHFPDTDARYKGASSIALLERVVELLAGDGYTAVNADITIVAERPKLKDYMKEMTGNMAQAMGIAAGQVNVKATTTEGLGFEGEGLGMSAHAVALIQRST